MAKIIEFDQEKEIWTINTDDLRSCFFAYDYLLNRNIIQYKTINPLGDLRFISAKGFCIKLTEFLATKYKRKGADKTEHLKQIMTHLQETYDASFLPLEYFSWIKKNKLACMWLWMKIRTETPIEDNRRTGRFIRRTRYKSRPKYLYSDMLELDKYPVSHKERFNLIINFFDKHSEKYRAERRKQVRQRYGHKTVLIEELRYLYDRAYIEDLKYQWLNIYNEKDQLDWLDKKNEKECRFAWDFLKNGHMIGPRKTKKIPEQSASEKEDEILVDMRAVTKFNYNFPFDLFLFSDNEERYLGIYGVVHNTEYSEDKTKLLALMKKLWQQNNRRKSSKKKKVAKPKETIQATNTEDVPSINNDVTQSKEPIEIKPSTSNKTDKQYAEFGHADFKGIDCF